MPITGSRFPFENHFLRGLLQIVYLANGGQRIDHRCGKIERAILQLCCFVVEREHVMVVVEAFTACEEGCQRIFSWSDVLVVGLIAEPMGEAVDAPGAVEQHEVS